MTEQKAIGNSPLRSCQIFIRNGRTLSIHFEIIVKESRTVGDKIESAVVAQYKTINPTQVHSILGKYGVASQEISDAGTVMSQNEHNAASFGWFGGFLYSFSDEVLQ